MGTPKSDGYMIIILPEIVASWGYTVGGMQYRVYTKIGYPPVIKHGWLERALSSSVIFLLKPPLDRGFSSHV